MCLRVASNLDDMNLLKAVVPALMAVAYSNLATLDYVMKRDSKPYDDARMMLDLGMELGLKRAKQEQENKDG